VSSISDAELAVNLARDAGDLLLSLADSGRLKGYRMGAAGDAEANRLIIEGLRQHRLHDAILSEEAADDRARLQKERVWIVDPLDGTAEYSSGRDDWAVHVALCVGGKAEVGAVAVPRASHVYNSFDPPALPDPTTRPRIVVSRTRPPSSTGRLAEALKAEIISLGSVGAKVAALLRGEADIYLHAGGLNEWDSCAPAAVALSAGFVATHLDGSPLSFNKPEPLTPDLLVCHPHYAAAVSEALRALGET
jgi:3'(2'), 5'-bisphosphate nucleotidase